jgi:hypothetical protein
MVGALVSLLARAVEAHQNPRFADASTLTGRAFEELGLPILIAIAFAGITVGPLAGLAIALVGRLRRGSIAPQRRLIEHLP